MADNRTQIIVREIKYWKDHKLLPETQCDFLLALYTQGDESLSTKKKWKLNPLLVVQVILLFLMVPFSFLVVYFTQFNSFLQLSILILFVSYAIWVFIYLWNQQSTYIHIPIVVSLLLLLVVTDLLVTILTLQSLYAYILFGVNFISWLVCGIIFKYRYLMISSIIAFIILLFANFSHLFSFNY
ncbi:hypothetical protein [Ornithinibacillus halotolerans]|uniref:Uncharacterized protein n=1 Tax=Ornithinibacillus halotolerans TaxID=1274357 RepID=A0A916RT86_9BACI|nr:hypothetical protein [Ornithinibacillus halotolerans]GGA68555.1 hypothetical protein GCM10008025_10670 [Ornithinibacillus halotolerans]